MSNEGPFEPGGIVKKPSSLPDDPVVAYDLGREHGENSAHSDWAVELDEALPIEVELTPEAVAAYIKRLRQAAG